MAVSIRKLAQGTAAYAGPLLYNYGYDQLNRITSMDPWAASGSFAPIGTAPMSDFAERYGYDPSGNILTLSRNGTTGNGGQLAMDNLSYHYIYAKSGGGTGEYTPGQAPTTGVDHLTNQLSSITDAVGSTNYTTDIDNQSAFNYSYDAIGNLVADVQAGITNITWSVYGKILSITNANGTIVFTYDAAGNRISKTAGGITTWYVRDAMGNVMAVYTQGDATKNSGALTQSEIHFYGSSRLGILTSKLNCTTLALPAQTVIVRGAKLIELSNHLGNVLATISDRKLQHTTDNSTVDYYTPDVISANDYYPGGMLMPGRTFNSQNLVNGFNGKRYGNEVYGVGNFQDYGMRMYDPRIVRFPSVDPLVKQYPELTPYQFASNRPIDGADVDGLEWDLRTTVRKNLEGHIYFIQDNKKAVEQRFQYYAFLAMKRETSLSQSQRPSGPYEQQLHQEYSTQRFQELGYNDDGSKPFLKRLSDNKTFNAFAENLALPMLEGFSYVDGAGELKAMFKGTREAVSFLGRTEFNALAKTGIVDAKSIRFSQNSISANFKNSEEIQTLINQLKNGQKIDIEPIRLVQKDDMIFTLDNRRLHAYQEAGIDIPYIKLDKIPKKELEKFTTTNNGTSIEVRKPKNK